MNEEPLFIWRSGDLFHYHVISYWVGRFYPDYYLRCIYCGNPYQRKDSCTPGIIKPFLPGMERGFDCFSRSACGLCGFCYEDATSSADEESGRLGRDDAWIYTCIAKLIKFKLKESKPALDELSTHLRTWEKGIDDPDLRNLNKTISDIFKNHGYNPRLDLQTRDGCYNLHLFENSKTGPVIVEYGHDSKERKTRIGIVQELRGVQLQLKIPKGTMVATSEPVSLAVSEAYDAFKEKAYYQLDLADIHLILRELECYNPALPPLEQDRRFQAE